MRLPWIQVQAEAFERAVELAALLKISEAQALGHMVWLWRAALSRGSADAIPDGIFEGRSAIAQMEAGSRWKSRGIPAELFKSLLEVGLVEYLASTDATGVGSGPRLRVRGIDRYGAAITKRAKDRERKKNSRNVARNSSGSRNESQGKTQTQTQNNDRAVTRRTRKASAAEEFFVWLNATRATTKNLPEQPAPSRSRLNKQFGAALVEVGRGELEGRYRAYLADQTNATKDPAWPWEVFAATWSWRKAATPATESQVFL